MPAQIITYVRGLLQAHNITATFLTREFGYSHDVITRFLKSTFDLEGIIFRLIYRWFGILNQGFLIIDDTVIPKVYGKKFGQAQYVYSSVLNRSVFGYQIVFLVWTNGIITIPLGWRYYQKATDGKTKIMLAQELLGEAKDKWKLKPYAVLFDSWYAATKLLDQIQAYGWKFVTQLKCNRIINACPIREELIDEGDVLIGYLTDTFQALILKHEGKYFASNDPLMSNKKVISLYKYRWKIEEVFRLLKQSLHLEECQATTFTSQQKHLESCIVAYLILEKERQLYPDKTLYQIKDDWMLNRKLGYHRINYYAVKVLTA